MILTPYLFFTGKGGVGKTSIAAATAVNIARSGKKVLLVSTDPASNLDDVLETKINQEPTETPVSGLWALNLDPEEAARDYREKLIGPYRGVFPDGAVSSMEEQLSGACTVEIAAFNLFCQLLTQPEVTGDFAHIIFDTAPTGHTLRLLSLPKAWSGYLGENTHGTSCIGPLAGLQEERQRYEKTVQGLADPQTTTLMMVTRPEQSSLLEAAKAGSELGTLGMENQQLIINGLFISDSSGDAAADALRQQQEQAVSNMPVVLKDKPQKKVPLLPVAPVGIDGLRLLTEQLAYGDDLLPKVQQLIEQQLLEEQQVRQIDLPVGLSPVVSDLGSKEQGIVLVMGKGGVGKTSIAAATALGLLKQGHRVHLSTTDPAAHLEEALAGAAEELGEKLTVSRIDPETEVETYRKEVMETAGADMDEEGLKLLEEDLASPCTEEIAVFRAFARAVDKVEEGFVVLDTAPTGHTLLLLDNTQSYHREVARSTGDIPEEVRQLLPRLRDPQLTHVIIATLAQATPVLEAARLQEDLRRAEIDPSWWAINQTWTGVETDDPVLKSLAWAEQSWIDKVTQSLAKKTVYIPWQIKPPKGHQGLEQLL